ncbi:hypothetical protein AYI69_g8168 [Smittium culicis]|uniref:Uncharacterized protein n=1 Tax=Smittium culicis TaxID=133412 RepID=A0A1R1XLK5_9FUNG|nr:hypothetical protein AYI69_g8168 [Smittium culicis]
MRLSVIELGILFTLKFASCQTENLDELTNDGNENQITGYSLKNRILAGYGAPHILRRPHASIVRTGYIPQRSGRIIVRPGGIIVRSGGIREREILRREMLEPRRVLVTPRTILRRSLHRYRAFYRHPKAIYRRPRVIYRRPGVIVPELSTPEPVEAPPVEASPVEAPPVEAPHVVAPPVVAPPVVAPPPPPAPVNPFDSGDYQFLLSHINNVLDHTQCNIDFFSGKTGKTVHARLQTKGCSNKNENTIAMKAAAKDLVDNATSKSTRILSCTVYMSWKYTTARNLSNGQREGTMNLAGYGQML